MHLLARICLFVALSVPITPPAGARINHSKEFLTKLKKSAENFIPTNNYVHRWIPFPQIESTYYTADTEEDRNFLSELGVAQIVIFIASWCIKCQEVIPDLELIRRDRENSAVQFLYVFSHDTAEAVQPFIKAYDLNGGIIANSSIMATFHDPPLPTVYIGDKNGWVLTRFLKTRRQDVPKIQETITALDHF